MRTAVLITGAGTGFGRLAAATLAQRGHTVFATMRDKSGRNAANAAELEELASSAQLDLQILELDVTDDDSVDTAVRLALDRGGRIDVLINNAGIGGLGVTEGYTVEQYHRIFDVNVFGAVRVNRAVLPAMRCQRSGLLIHVSSGAGRYTVPFMAAYCASKFALESLAESFRFEGAPFGIDSVVVEPGIFRTPIFDRLFTPADSERVAECAPLEEYLLKVQGVFDAAVSAPDAPDPQMVADVFLRLIETPPGQRPFRTVVSPRPGLLAEYNTAAEDLRARIAERFQVPELLKLAGL